MSELGKRLTDQGIITQPQLEAALRRQRTSGGRLGQNLKALGLIRDQDMDMVFHRTPPPPRTLADTGLEPALIEGLLVKHMLALGDFRLHDLSARLKLPASVLEEEMNDLKAERLIEVKPASARATLAYEFRLTDLGRERAHQLMAQCRYVGPAPVPLDAYAELVEIQTVRSVAVTEREVLAALGHLVLPERTVHQLGPALTSGQAIFLYGPPGNGKTSIAEAVSHILHDPIFLPYAVAVGDQIIRVFDPINHVPIDRNGAAEPHDQRWISVQRPVVMTGGELTLKMLDLDFNEQSMFYDASLQMKANNGLLIIDDFGRQLVEPHLILNRWIVPLDRRIDFLTLHTGMKFSVPFDMLMIFATNLDPKQLVDDAFLRRIRYKIRLGHPSAGDFRKIFEVACQRREVRFDPRVYDWMVREFYLAGARPFSASHPRDLVDHIVSYARYYDQPPELNEETVRFACENYFVH